jgi:hypothetical protein
MAERKVHARFEVLVRTSGDASVHILSKKLYRDSNGVCGGGWFAAIFFIFISLFSIF